MNDDERLLTISEFAERARLAPSALRYYDDAGVLRPAHVDAHNGYRRYAPEQVRTAILLRELRALDMPIAEIQALLDAEPAARHRLLEEHWRRVEERVSAARARLDQAHALIDDADDGTAPIITIDALQLAAAIRQVLPAAPRSPHRLPAGALLEVSGNVLRLVATDGYRLAMRDLVPAAIVGDDDRRVVPWAALDALEARLRRTGEAAYRLRLSQFPEIATTFPAYRSVLDGLQPPAHRLVANARELRQRVSLAVRVVRLAEFEPPVMVALDRDYLEEALTATVGPDVILETARPLSPVIVRSADDGSFTALVMPIRLSDAQ